MSGPSPSCSFDRSIVRYGYGRAEDADDAGGGSHRAVRRLRRRGPGPLAHRAAYGRRRQHGQGRRHLRPATGRPGSGRLRGRPRRLRGGGRGRAGPAHGHPRADRSRTPLPGETRASRQRRPDRLSRPDRRGAVGAPGQERRDPRPVRRALGDAGGRRAGPRGAPRPPTLRNNGRTHLSRACHGMSGTTLEGHDRRSERRTPVTGTSAVPDPWTQRSLDTDVPQTARVWNYFLGGTDNSPPDRAAGERIAKVNPPVLELARASRAFLVRAVRHLTAEA